MFNFYCYKIYFFFCLKGGSKGYNFYIMFIKYFMYVELDNFLVRFKFLECIWSSVILFKNMVMFVVW